MEILRPALSTEIKERAGFDSIPDLINFSSKIPGRAIDSRIETLTLGSFRDQLMKIKKEGKRDKKRLDKVGVLYLNGNGLYLSEDGYFTENQNLNTITVAVEEPKVHPANPQKYMPKEKSIGAIIHYSQTDTLPMADNLLHLLLEDKHFKAATAAFFLTSRDNIYALFRTHLTPQADIHRGKKIVKNMKTVQKEFYWAHSHEGITMKIANMCVLREAIESYGLHFFHGDLKKDQLRKSSPELHLT